MKRSKTIKVQLFLKVTAVTIIQVILCSNLAVCFAGDYAILQNKMDINTLAPELNIGSLELQKQLIFQRFNAAETKIKNELAQDALAQPNDSQKEQAGFWSRTINKIHSWIEKRRGDFYLLLILRVNNPLIRKKACKDLIALNDERVFKLLRIMGLSEDAVSNGKFRQRAEKALLDMHNLNPALSEKLGFKKTLFEIVRKDSREARSRAIELIEKIGIWSDEGLDQIIQWLQSDSWYLRSKAAQQIKKLGKRRLKKLKEKNTVAHLLKAATRASMTQPVFLAIIDAMKTLEADNVSLEQAARSCFFNPDNSPIARGDAAIIMAQTSSNKRRTLRILARFGLKDEHLAVRLGTIEAIAVLGEVGGIAKLKNHRQLVESKLETSNVHHLDQDKEKKLIEEAIAQLEMPHILGLYDEVTKEHVINVHALAKIAADVQGLNSEDAKILMRAALKHDLGKSMKRYYATVVIPAKYEPGDIDLETFRIEHSFVSDNLVEEYHIDTPVEEHLIIRNHHRPDILQEDPDFKDLSLIKRKKIIQLVEMLMILDWLCGRSEISRPPNWFDRIELKQEDVVSQIKARYCDTLNYEFSIDVEALINKIFSSKPAMKIINNNMVHNPKLIAYAMKSWTGDLDFYINVFKCRILSLGDKDMQGTKKFIDTMADPLFEEILLAEATKQDYKRAKEILTEAVESLLSNKEIKGRIERYLKKTAKNKPQALLSAVVQSFYGYKLYEQSELIPWDAYFNRSFTLKKDIKAAIKVLDRETAQKYADEIIVIQNANHPTSKISKEELLGNYIYDAEQRRHTPGKWEHSLIAFNKEGKVIGFALNYERSKAAYKECSDAQDSLYMHIVDVDREYQNIGLATLLVVNSISKFVNTGFKFLKQTDDVFITIQTRADNHPMKTVLENKIGFELAGTKVYSQRKVDAIYALSLTQNKAPENKDKGYMPAIIKRQTLAEKALHNAVGQAI